MANCTPGFSQVQLGVDIDGEASGDRSGFSVSLSSEGNHMAIGAPGNNGSEVGVGHVRVYAWDGSGWIQQGEDIEGASENDGSGYSVSMSADGSRLAISAISNADNGINTGHVRVYSWDGARWAQLGADINGEAEGDQSGISISLSANGNRLAVGSRQNAGNGMNAGHVRVYGWDDAEWVQLGVDIDGERGEQAGSSVSLSADGNRVAIGARFSNGNGGNSGKVRIYDWDGFGWVRLGADLDGEAPGDQTGWSVSLSADGARLAIGAPPNDGNGDHSGHVRVYDWDSGNWVQLGNDIDGEAPGDRSGESVSLSADGSHLAVGATDNNGNGDKSGHVRVYRWDGAAWAQRGTDIDGETANDQSGRTVSLSADGTRLAIGSSVNSGNGEEAGHVRVYGFIPNAVTGEALITIKAFPNPSSGEIYFSGVEADRVQLFDGMGRLLSTEEQPGRSINISEVPMGMYLLKIGVGEKTYLARVVKQ